MGMLEVLGLKPPRRLAKAGTPATLPAADASARAAGDEVDAPASVPPPGADAGPAVVPTDDTGASHAADGGGAPAPTLPAAPVDKNLAAIQTARAAVQKLVDDLKAHAQTARITLQIQQAEAKLGEVDAAAAAKDYKKAAKHLAEAKALCVAAKTLADGWVAYLRQSTDMKSLAMSFDAINDPQVASLVQPILDAADLLANKTPPDFAGATKKLREIGKALEPRFKKLIDAQKAKLGAMEKMGKAVREFSSKDIEQARTFIAEAERALGAHEWSVCRQNAFAAGDVVGPGVRMGERRGRYDQQRATTVAAVAKVRAAAAVREHGDALDKLVAEADALASYEVRKFEQGTAKLEDCARQAGVWTGLAATLAQYAKDRVAADAELAALAAHVAAANIANEREAARLRLVEAGQLATAAQTAADPAGAWALAVTALARARADLAAAKTLAAGLGAAVGAQAAAAKPDDKAGLKKALDTLRADGKLAAAAAHAKLAQAEFKRFDDQVAGATKALADGDGGSAATALAAAAQALAQAKTIQVGHAQFAAGLGEVEAAVKALQKSPRAAKIQGRIDPAAAALADAKAKDAAHAVPDAMAALRQAKDAVAAAKAADQARAAFDTAAGDLAKRIAKVPDAAEKAALEALAAGAATKADGFDFAEAKKANQAIGVRLDKAQLEAMMKAKPDDPKIATTAARMVANGGEATVDGMIQAIPDGGDMRLLNALAQGRFGVKFKSGKPLPPLPPDPTLPADHPLRNGRPAGDPAKAMKAVCEMFSKIPQDIVKNKSITGVSYEDKFGGAGGAYAPDDGAVSMNGRAGAIKQKFGANQKNRDPVTKALVPQLPAAIDEECKPANEDEVEYLAFAAAHEVGHGMDDSSGFMARDGGKEKYGGWITYGSSVQPIADAVGTDDRFKEFYKTPEQKRYILDRLQNAAAVAPPVTPGSAEATALGEFEKWFKLATAANVFRRQGDCDKIKIGKRIYHEAYSRVWVSYLADARSKALTGYQFRAPGEWFAELYAGFRSGKLKDTHPAMDWLKKL